MKLSHEFIQQPDNPLAPAPSRRYPLVDEDWATQCSPSKAFTLKYHRIKTWLHPEPGKSFSYDEWKVGKNNRAVVPGRMIVGRKTNEELPPKDDHEFYTLAIEEDFADQGLQVVVEIGSIELTPEQPTKEATDWQLSGLPNEHIVATTVMYFSSENVTATSGSMSFRVEADLDPIAHVWGPKANSNPYHPVVPLADIYEFTSHLEMCGDEDMSMPGGPALQVLGTVETPDGRLVAFPNVMQSRTEAFTLSDPSRSGCRKFLKLYLVDPHYRICSTRNTPPQQHAWWYEAGSGRIGWGAYNIPREVAHEVESLVEGFPMGLEEAIQRREEFRKERKEKFHRLIEEEVTSYRFGEWAIQTQL